MKPYHCAPPQELGVTGRYALRPALVLEAAARSGFTVEHTTTFTPREDGGTPVEGALYVLRRQVRAADGAGPKAPAGPLPQSS